MNSFSAQRVVRSRAPGKRSVRRLQCCSLVIFFQQPGSPFHPVTRISARVRPSHTSTAVGNRCTSVSSFLLHICVCTSGLRSSSLVCFGKAIRLTWWKRGWRPGWWTRVPCGTVKPDCCETTAGLQLCFSRPLEPRGEDLWHAVYPQTTHQDFYTLHTSA